MSRKRIDALREENFKCKRTFHSLLPITCSLLNLLNSEHCEHIVGTIQSVIYLFIPFNLLLIPSFFHSLIYSLNHLFVHPFVDCYSLHLILCPLNHSFTQLLVHSLIRLLNHLLTQSFVESTIHSFNHSFTQLLIHPIIHSHNYQSLNH